MKKREKNKDLLDPTKTWKAKKKLILKPFEIFYKNNHSYSLSILNNILNIEQVAHHVIALSLMASSNFNPSTTINIRNVLGINFLKNIVMKGNVSWSSPKNMNL